MPSLRNSNNCCMTEHLLRIADFDIRLENRSGLPMALEAGYGPFLVKDFSPGEKVDMIVRCHAGIPEELKADAKAVFFAGDGEGELWNISRWGDGYRFMVNLPDAPFTLQHVALTDSAFRQWDIHSAVIEEGGERGICPLAYPMGPLLMYSLTVHGGAMMIHASGVFDGERGRIFSGFSGVGKSTMAGIWGSQGATVINDDRLIIRRHDSGHRIHNTPMFYEDTPRSAPLHAVFLPFHSPENRIERLHGSEAVSGLMAYCIQHSHDAGILSRHLDFVSDLCDALPVFRLGVVPDEAIVPFIRTHEARS